MTRLLITGGTGYVGAFLIDALLHGDRVGIEAVYYTHCSHAALSLGGVDEGEEPWIRAVRVDLTDESAVQGMLDMCKPDIIVHTAAFTNTSLAERDPEQCMRVNKAGTEWLVRHMSPSARLILFSTDWVYGGDAARSESDKYREDVDATDADTAYGRSKVEAERVLRAVAAERHIAGYVILRSALIFGPPSPLSGNTCFAEWFDRALADGKKVSLFVDEFRSPVYVRDIVGFVMYLLAHPDSVAWHNQVFNMGGREVVSRYDFGVELAKARGYDLSLLERAEARIVFANAKRPSKLGLDVSKLLSVYPLMHDLPTALRDMVSAATAPTE